MDFKLEPAFIKEYSTKKPNFGFNGLGELVYLRTYSRLLPDGSNEQWYQTIQRVVEGTYSLQKEHITNLKLGWNEKQAQRSAKEMYSRMFDMKFLPPGRGLWAMGTDIINKKGLAASLNNCGFISTKDLHESFSKPFTFLMDMSMLGVGVGFDTEGEGKVIIRKNNKQIKNIIIEDTREGWVESVKLLLDSFNDSDPVVFDYSQIRPAGIPLKTFGGLSSGPQPLITLHSEISKVLTTNLNKPITVTTIVDIMNLIGKCVVAGNIRRCLPRGTLVHTVDGLIPIESVSPGTKVYTSTGVAETVDYVYQGVQEVISIHSELGEFECTSGHKMATIDGSGEIVWKRADSLTNENLVFVKNIVKGIETSIQYDTYTINVTDQIAKIIGYLNGLGYNELRFPNMREKGEVLFGNEEIYLLYSTLEQKVKDFFDNFINNDIQNVPTYILKGVESTRREYLNGLLLSMNGNIMTTAFVFAKKIQALYASLGIPCSLSVMKRNLLKNTNSVMYTLREINHLESIGNIIPIRIAYLSRHGTLRETYDISVKDTPEFIASEGLLVHNTAEIAFGKKDSVEFMDLKDYSLNPHRMDYGWTSNNSIFADLGMDYTAISKRIILNGEPGIAWLENMRSYSRMVDLPDNKDYRVMGGNPCLEQSLESSELCCLVESFPTKADSLEDYLRTLKFAYLYAKTVTLGLTHCEETNRVQLRNRRIGCSVSGIAQFLSKNNLHTLNHWLDTGYSTLKKWDTIYSEWLCIPRSIKMTSIKPSGTVSLLVGATPGMHYPESRFYIRRMRLSINSPLVGPLKTAGYYIEPAVGSEQDTLVVEIPVDVGEGIRTVNDVSIWEQVALAANMQRWWADNQVSCTVTFNPKTEGTQIANVLDYFQYQLKGISFLPKCDYGAFPQMPYEEITEEKYYKILNNIRTLQFTDKLHQDGEGEMYCDSTSCVLIK